MSTVYTKSKTSPYTLKKEFAFAFTKNTFKGKSFPLHAMEEYILIRY
jgi:hypothetical protein